MRVFWPRSGDVQTFENVAGNRIVEITEGRDEVVEKVYPPAESAEEVGDDDAPADG